MNRITGNPLWRYRKTLAAGILLLVWLMVSGCGRREAEFLANAGQSQEEVQAAADAVNKKASGQEETGVQTAAEAPETDTEDGQRDGCSEADEKEVMEEKIYVDICGAVVNPGVYQLETDSRVFHAIEAAGGLLPEAAGEYVNRAGSLSDGQQIYIPTREEADSLFKSPSEQMASAQAESGKSSSDTVSLKINLNTADEAALTTLTGIGTSKAQAIITYREEHGGFSAIEEILNVPGIKEGTFTKIKDNIAVE